MSRTAENIERAALLALHRAAPPDVAAALGLQHVEIDGALVSIASRVPPSGIVANRTIGLGLEQPATRDGVAAIAALYRGVGVDRYFVHVHPDAAAHGLPGWLGEAGLEPARGWMKFERATGPAASVETTLDVHRIEPGEESLKEAFGRIVCDAFDLGARAAPWLACLPGAGHWHGYVSLDGEKPAGTGGLYVEDGVGWLDWGATAPTFRKRGSQSALLARRIEDAIAMGCRVLHTATGEEVPGDPQHSYRNILKAGFTESYVRANHAPPRR